MSCTDQRSAAACPWPAARVTLRTPVTVVELDLDRPGELRSPGGVGPASPDGRVLALVRLHGHPLGLVTTSGEPGSPAGTRRALVSAASRAFGSPTPGRAVPVPAPVGRGHGQAPLPSLSVVIATRDRPLMLRQCLDALLRSAPEDLEVIVVDNAPTSDASQRLIAEHYPRVRYLREPVPGLARAHNRGLAAVHGAVTAFTDDDTLPDPGWARAVQRAFAEDPRIACVTGLIVPAELDTPTQAALESHGGFAKGFTPRTWTWDRGRTADPLFPFTAGQFGSGANMAFRTAPLRALGGFDPATGTGTPARGGDDLLAFLRVLAAGHALAYRPDALVWHRHRRTPEALPAQVFGYSAGLTAYLTAALAHHPALIPALLRRLPRGLALYALRSRRRSRTAPPPDAPPWPSPLLELRGLLYGPLGYLRARTTTRAPRGTEAP